MKKEFYTFLFIILSSLAHSQTNSSFVGWATESRVLSNLDRAAAYKENVESGYSFNSTKSGDTLILSVSGPEKNLRRLAFDKKKKKCNFDELILPACNQCTRQQVEVIINNKKMRWKEIARNTYLSCIVYHTLLTINYNVNNKCTVMTFKDLKVHRNEYLDLYGNYGDYATTKSMTDATIAAPPILQTK